MLALIRERWQRSDRGQTLEELNNLLNMQYDLERDAGGIRDAYVREYVYGRLDAAASARRSIAEDIRWDLQESEGNPACQKGREA